ncbi:hypothetical protein HYH03_006589 [Edaphochlamys debaryana]|uniref:Uncharacterized protein n=1 Tax=Edaphochlamys debaryana TaxID=47281 RepID=A0A835Y3N1_9CHLO|nr:hypothetical protein HYH03_006589 [Edaphochlamys debaryana]|eukprot:KAG2495318.1 hypothetical protein HYH03_006589 [Edaphochlamys debaryana]
MSAQRQLLRGACRALTGFSAPSRGAVSNNGSTGTVLRSLLGASGARAAAPSLAGAAVHCPAVFQMSGLMSRPSVPMGFAASAPCVSATLSLTGSLQQVRGVSSTELSEDGDSDEGTSLTRGVEEDEPPDGSLLPLLDPGGR